MPHGEPPAAHVADANVLLAVLIRGRARLILTHPSGPHCLPTEVVREEVVEYLPVLTRQCGINLGEVQSAFAALPVEWRDADSYARFRDQALRRIGHRDPDDWPTVALALALDLPIWSQDKDLEESGVRVYTTGELLDALREIDTAGDE